MMSEQGVACREEKDTGDIFDDADVAPAQQQREPSPAPYPLADHSYPKSSPHGQV